MIAIAESGSTKCDWVVLNQENEIALRFKSQGYNPYFHTSQIVANDLVKNDAVKVCANKIKQVFFYGAGCSSEDLNDVIKIGLKKVFTHAEITVDHDLLASAYAVYQNKPVISCILGTGSNSCLFDGETVKESNHALGFILGDEGGGAYFGKQFLADFFYKKLPKDILADFDKDYGLTWKKARKYIYGNDKANVYLASFMPFIAKHKNHGYVKSLISKGFSSFIENHVMSFEEALDVEIGFVGSIASVFEPILKAELDKRSLTLGKIIKQPIEELVAYHSSTILINQ